MCFHAYSGYEQERTKAKNELKIDRWKIYKTIMASGKTNWKDDRTAKKDKFNAKSVSVTQDQPSSVAAKKEVSPV